MHFTVTHNSEEMPFSCLKQVNVMFGKKERKSSVRVSLLKGGAGWFSGSWSRGHFRAQHPASGKAAPSALAAVRAWPSFVLSLKPARLQSGFSQKTRERLQTPRHLN